MILKEVYDRFAKKTPVCVMVRATIENVLAADRLDAIFDEHAEQQYAGDLMFSTVDDIKGLVVCNSLVVSVAGPLKVSQYLVSTVLRGIN